MINDPRDIARIVRRAVETARTADMHTHLFAPAFEPLLLSGIDEMLTYHYLVAEALRWLPASPLDFRRLDKRAQADLVWTTLFIDRSPVSEASRGVVTSLAALGMDPGARDLAGYREIGRAHV
jgi:hypothetical protein